MARIDRWWRAAGLLTVVALGLGLGGCGGGEAQPIRIGAVLPLSGDWSLYGEPIRRGIELAHEQVQAEYENETYPQPVELVIEDSASNPLTAASALEGLLRNDVFAVIGGVTSAEALAMTEGLDKAERVLLSPSASSPSLSGTSRYFFRIFPSDFREGTKIGSFAALKLDLDNAVVLAVNNPFARGISSVFQDEFVRYDGEVLGEIVYPDDAESYGRYVDDALEQNPQSVFIADFAEETRAIIESLRGKGFEGVILTTSAYAQPEIISATGAPAEGVVLAQTLFDPMSEDENVAAFAKAYSEKYGELPGLFAAHGYDAFKVITEAARDNRLPSDMWQDLRSLDYPGVTGQIQFDEKGDVGKFPRVYQIRDGVLLDYDEIVDSRKREREKRRQQLFKELERVRSGGT
jgi:branched-chain amino acid transport system substrate-binding protein